MTSATNMISGQWEAFSESGRGALQDEEGFRNSAAMSRPRCAGRRMTSIPSAVSRYKMISRSKPFTCQRRMSS